MNSSFVNKIFQENITFQPAAKEIFLFQYEYNDVYKQWCDAINVSINKIYSLESIPFVPVSFFKTHKVFSGNENFETVFESSGTTQSVKSKHFLKDLSIYIKKFFNLL